MNPHIEALFQFTRSHISDQHLWDFLPRNSGDKDYLHRWSPIVRLGKIPRQYKLELSEVIEHMGRLSPEAFKKKTKKKQRFREFRRFTSAVAVVLIDLENDAEEVRSEPNDLARDLIIDVSLENREHFELVRNVLPVMRDRLIKAGDEDYPFFALSSMILAHKVSDHKVLVDLASQLIDDEYAVRNKRISWLNDYAVRNDCLADLSDSLSLTKQLPFSLTY